jgi:hypothetical protein
MELARGCNCGPLAINPVSATSKHIDFTVFHAANCPRLVSYVPPKRSLLDKVRKFLRKH